MAHFAQIDDNNVVVNILTVPDEQQSRGQDYLANDLQLGGRWIQTSYNGNVRKMYAGVGYIYNEEFDFFLPPKPYPSWELDTYLRKWTPPVVRPENVEGKVWIWDEENGEWNQEDLPTPIIS